MFSCYTIFLVFLMFFFCFNHNTAYELRISDWSSDVCSSDLCRFARAIPDGASQESRANARLRSAHQSLRGALLAPVGRICPDGNGGGGTKLSADSGRMMERAILGFLGGEPLATELAVAAGRHGLRSLDRLVPELALFAVDGVRISIPDPGRLFLGDWFENSRSTSRSEEHTSE